MQFTGSYSYSGFRSCIAINPWDYRGTSQAIEQALTMSAEEAQSRWEDLHNHVTTQTAQAFATSFLTRVVRTHLEHHPASDATAGIDLARLRPRYATAKRRLLLLDLEGTLWERDPLDASRHPREGAVAAGAQRP